MMMMTQAQLLEVAKGNADAAGFLAAFQGKAHLMDDVVDRDVPERMDREHVLVELDWLLALTQNPFVQSHRGQLVPVIVLGMNAWLDANQWEVSVDKRKRTAADVLKGFYHEVMYLVALLCGGFDHMRAMSAKYRSYDFEEN